MHRQPELRSAEPWSRDRTGTTPDGQPIFEIRSYSDELLAIVFDPDAARLMQHTPDLLAAVATCQAELALRDGPIGSPLQRELIALHAEATGAPPMARPRGDRELTIQNLIGEAHARREARERATERQQQEQQRLTEQEMVERFNQAMLAAFDPAILAELAIDVQYFQPHHNHVLSARGLFGYAGNLYTLHRYNYDGTGWQLLINEDRNPIYISDEDDDRTDQLLTAIGELADRT